MALVATKDLWNKNKDTDMDILLLLVLIQNKMQNSVIFW
jgi:hypothetical protein